MEPYDHLITLSNQFPNAWNLINKYTNECTWPHWCFLPMEAWDAIVSEEYNISHLNTEQKLEATELAAIGTWRYTQGIYEFEPQLFEELLNSQPIFNIKISDFYNLPEWSIYLDTPGLLWNKKPLHGLWCHIGWHMEKQSSELRLLLNSHQVIPIVIPLAGNDLDEFSYSLSLDDKQCLNRICILLNYICKNTSQIGNKIGQHPQCPSFKMYKGGFRIFPPHHTNFWWVEKNDERTQIFLR